MTEPAIAPRQTAEDWNPRTDPEFRDDWILHLRHHEGEHCHATDLWETHDAWQKMVLRQVACEEVELARRLGDLIEGDKDRGYAYVGRKRSLWVRTAAPKPHHVKLAGHGGFVPGQLKLTEGVG